MIYRADIDDIQQHANIVLLQAQGKDALVERESVQIKGKPVIPEYQIKRDADVARKLHAAADYLQPIVDRMKSQRERAA